MSYSACASQIPEEDACPVVAEMLRLMTTDSCSTVREAALESICISKITLPSIMMRVRDVTKSVRTQAREKMMRVVQAGVDPDVLDASELEGDVDVSLDAYDD